MAHVSSAVKEMYFHSLAAALAAGGLGALVFDNRNFDASDGEPRQDFLAPNRAAMQQDRAARFRGDPPAMVPLVDPDPMAVSALPTPVTGSSSTWAGTVGDDESQELSGGGESHVS